jgi:membrane dipeptidase
MPTPKIFDAHCDVLMKMFLDHTISFKDSSSLNVNYDRLKASGGKIQCFAIYIPEKIHPNLRFEVALSMIDIFYEKVLTLPNMKQIKSPEDIRNLGEDEIGAILTLEGCDCIGEDLLKLKTLLRLGVWFVGLTWNYANYVADGALEERGAGLSGFGKKVVDLLHYSKTWCDVSHLSEKGFWDVLERTPYVLASHSNCHTLCPHPRNLKDEQIQALIQNQSVIGVTFVPEFLKENANAQIKDILHHIDHICSLGGEKHIGFGSDFDGIEKFVKKLENFEGYSILVEELYKHYSSSQIDGFLYKNFIKLLMKSS